MPAKQSACSSWRTDRALTCALLLPADAQQGLHVVAYLMGDDIRLGEVTRRPVSHFEIVEEGEVQVDMLVTGAVEGSYRCRGHATG
jgi:hypothetical protein